MAKQPPPPRGGQQQSQSQNQPAQSTNPRRAKQQQRAPQGSQPQQGQRPAKGQPKSSAPNKEPEDQKPLGEDYWREVQGYLDDDEEGHWSEEGVGRTGSDDPSWDCIINAIVRVSELRVGRSSNPNNKGRPYFSARLKVEKIFKQSLDPRDPKESSEIVPGGFVSHFNWLPVNPPYVTSEEGFHLDEMVSFGSAILELQPQYFDAETRIPELAEAGGKKVEGYPIGVRTRSSVKEDDETGQVIGVYYNVRNFYPVDDNGQQVRRKTPDELKAEKQAQQGQQQAIQKGGQARSA